MEWVYCQDEEQEEEASLTFNFQDRAIVACYSYLSEMTWKRFQRSEAKYSSKGQDVSVSPQFQHEEMGHTLSEQGWRGMATKIFQTSVPFLTRNYPRARWRAFTNSRSHSNDARH